jgi:epoxyqueuosine reductase
MPDRVLAAQVLKEEAKRLGFVRAGIARADEPPHFGRFRDWIAGGHHARMFYLERTTEVRGRPQDLLPGAQSILCLADLHPTSAPVAPDGTRVARYVLGSDYHQTLRERAERVAQAAMSRLGLFRYRVCVDSTPIAERAFAAAAGLGWIGKNGCVIDPEQGSFLLLAEIVTDLDLPPDEPMAERCGSCVRCLEACPTQAFLEPGSSTPIAVSRIGRSNTAARFRTPSRNRSETTSSAVTSVKRSARGTSRFLSRE